jgi:16S rRNA (cytidine1402-2'-O)-methyltransferase
MVNKTGTLYIVATPIGNPKDITLRALEILQSADIIVCEEVREGTTLLKKIGLSGKSIISLNEHNEAEQVPEIIQGLFQNKSVALISDCGTPVFADPGAYLIQQASDLNLPVVPIPGPSSMMAALSILDFKLERFTFAGFLPRDSDLRAKELKYLRTLRMPVILMDTPYRLGRLLDEVIKTYGGGQKITLACDLTLPSESILRGAISSIRHQVGQRKCEFILIIH